MSTETQAVNHAAALDQSTRLISDLQMALRVIHELIDGGPGNAGQLANRMTDKDHDGAVYTEALIDDALTVLDQYSLLHLPELDDEHGPVELWS